MLLVFGAGGAAFLILLRHPPAKSAATTAPQAVIQVTHEAPASPAPQKPRISEDTRSRVLNFVEKAVKLSTLTEQGVGYAAFTHQLAEVKSAWDTLMLASWPQGWKEERAYFEVTIEGWNLAKEIWDRKLKTDDFQFTMMGDGKLYGERLEHYSKSVCERLDDNTPQRMLDAIYAKPTGATEKTMMADSGIKWCMSTSSLLLSKAREGIKTRLNEGRDEAPPE